MSTTTADTQYPLCVDLDGTLVRTDILIESFLTLLRENPRLALMSPFWLLKGKAFLKKQIADRVAIDIPSLPYNEAFLGYLRKQRDAGRRLILATASHEKFAKQVAGHLGLFDGVLASNDQVNLTGLNKLRRLRERFGDGGFDYAGNAREDLKIWPYARRAILVNPEAGVRPGVADVTNVDRVFDDRQARVKTYARALRLHQWLKNVLVFIPLVAGHEVGNLSLIIQAMLAFVAFSLCASSGYLLNDLLDLGADRAHPGRRYRPFAAGALSIKQGVVMIPVLLLMTVGVAFLLPGRFLGVIGAYYVFTLAYSIHLKKMPLVDVLLLAGLYTLRIFAGSAATGISPSFWLLAFSMFLFLSLAIVKRYAELLIIGGNESEFIKGRGYQVVDRAVLGSLGAASGYLAVIVLALYINSGDVKIHYRYPEVIWLLCPLLLFWISRMWLTAGRGAMHNDPLVFAIKDRASQWIMLAGAIFLWVAT
jgi:4-hydroxybenzoate polyprenyltransferase